MVDDDLYASDQVYRDKVSDWVVRGDEVVFMEQGHYLLIAGHYWDHVVEAMRYLDYEENDIEGIILHKSLETHGPANHRGRVRILNSWPWMYGKYKIHFQGIFKSLHELDPRVDSLHTSFPWRLATLGRSLNEERPYPGEFQWEQEVDESLVNLARRNFEELFEKYAPIQVTKSN